MKITEACDGCAKCDAVCPLEAILKLASDENKRWIDPDLCGCCSACVSECPIGAIIDED